MDDDMKQKYQKYNNDLLTGTLTDLMIKSISFQANIKLANDVIAENEKVINQLQTELDETKNKLQSELNEVRKQLDETLKNRSSSDNNRIIALENDLKSRNDIINKLNLDLGQMNKIKSENEALKVQAINVDTFRNQLVRERDAHQQTRTSLEDKIAELNQKIENLQNPPRRKRVVKQQVNEVNLLELTAESEESVKDGGSF